MFYVVSVYALFGLLIGSAINAMVWRLYVGRSWVRGRSVCPDCGHELAAKDLVPLVSWMLLRGKCRYCGKRIHWQYPAVELVTAALFALTGYASQANFGWYPGYVELAFWLVMLTMLIVLAVYDLRWMILPDKVMLPLIVIAFGFDLMMAALAHKPTLLISYLLAAVLAGGAFYAIVFFSKGRAMGGGDIKLAFAMGLILGLQNTAVALQLAFLAGATVGVAMVLMKRRGRKDQIPFGPFLVAGTVTAYLFGHPIIEWYLGLVGVI